MEKHIHFIGIGGIGMSALARFWQHEGAVVTGSDRESSIVTVGLEELGISITYEQTAENISTKQDLKLVVYTEAMPHDHPELVAARTLGIPVVNYFEALGQVANEYYLIAVAGSHGKTTTTAMIIDILEEGGLDPTGIVGSLRSKTKSNFRAGKSKYAVVEACEYKRDFLHLKPDVLVITNIEYEHVDYYKDLVDVQSAFRSLAETIPADGAIVANVTDPNVVPVLAGLTANIIDYRPQIDLSLTLRHPGMHNRMNAAAARTAAEFVGVETIKVNEALEWFAGTWRRFEYKGEVNGAPVYDDYGHHPTELRATFAGVRELYPDHRLKVVFQSHTYSRTHELFDDFVTVLATADEVTLLPIYAAREENVYGVTSEKLAAAIMAVGTACTVYETIPACALAIKESLSFEKKEVVLVIGAGPVTEVAKLLTE
ncbi:MAG: UDP-N-acetylmuramate--L-alanine ligase [Candidatus Pacebacteria bacterium]|jgi:UDP-N-acetylmuramate--alanine ligase|nr:UDP-N-acetylmuramate--L-alanine ligase [Candidatus Paceibacterota bacterium]